MAVPVGGGHLDLADAPPHPWAGEGISLLPGCTKGGLPELKRGLEGQILSDLGGTKPGVSSLVQSCVGGGSSRLEWGPSKGILGRTLGGPGIR